jgi:hypothetical protein
VKHYIQYIIFFCLKIDETKKSKMNIFKLEVEDKKIKIQTTNLQSKKIVIEEM